MLSNPTTRLQQRQRQHRRQNSTPTAFEATKVQTLPTITRHGSHRRGMSLDQRRQQFMAQQEQKVSTTNQGFDHQQYLLREAQQQRPQRPGQQVTYDFGEVYPISPQTSPHRPQFDPGHCSPYTGPVHSINQITTHSRHQSLGGQDFNLFDDAPLGQPSFLDFQVNYQNQMQQQGWQPAEPISRPSSAGRRVSNGIANRVAKFENLGADIPRLLTPPNPDASSYFPITPGTTPHRPVPQRFVDGYDESMEETIKPVRSRSHQRTKSIFDEMRETSERQAIPSPPGTAPMPGRSTFDSAPIPSPDFLNISNLNMDFAKVQVSYRPVSYNSLRSGTPETPSPGLHDGLPSTPSNENRQRPLLPNGPVGEPQTPEQSQEDGSLDDINIEESITETGITGDDIAAFIEGPDPVDNKWVCLYPNCKKKFGRKENIKSHVQTHLGDRQYQCPYCKKCFVRQHDLKRHAKIHSGVKPYPCLCGNSFARHDALTRHRQRGMCIGAFEGIVKKVAKRGRPRKHRPDDESRLDKSSRTRSRNKTASSVSSCSEYSDCSVAGGSPPSHSELMDDSTIDEFKFSQNSEFVSSPAHSGFASDCVSPQAIQHDRSPSQLSLHSLHSSHRGSVVSLSELTSHPSSPAKSNASVYGTPPELCLSSSPPPSGRYFDLDVVSSQVESVGMDSLASLPNMNESGDVMFLDAFPAPMSQLEHNPDLLMMGKFDEAFCANDIDQEMFHSSGAEDVFFGSP